jgi:hypothetical protein
MPRIGPTRGGLRLIALAAGVAALGLAALPQRVAAAAAADQPRPDVQYVYDQIDFMSSNYLMRYSGFDGPPGDLNPQDGNLPPQVNGWQEFYQHWREQMTSPTVMGSFARFVHYDDHLFWSLGQGSTPYQSDAATVTIPGSVCPGQSILVAGHPDSTPGLNTGNGSTYDDTSGVVMGIGELSALTRWWQASGTWPTRTIKVGLFDAEETGLNGSQFYASHLVPSGPQGRYILVANMDQNGLEYPAYPAGSTQTTFGPHPWYTNVNASPLNDSPVYTGDDAAHIKANMPAIKHFRAALAQQVSIAFHDLGEKYGYSLPLENPIEQGRTVPAYQQSDIALYSPVQDDDLGRTDQVPFIAQGIPGYGIVGAYDSNQQDNPLESPETPLTPLGASGIPQIAGYDTPRDNIIHYNLMTSGTDGGGFGGPGSIAVKRALELPMTWTLGLLARPEYVGRSPMPSGPLAYFEALPVSPNPGDAVAFNGGASADLGGGGLSYAWDFGDGAHATGATPAHTYSSAGWYDARLTVSDGAGRTSTYHEEIPVGAPKSAAPATDACGRASGAAAVQAAPQTGLAAVLGSATPAAAAPRLPNTASGIGSAGAVQVLPLLGVAALRLRRRRQGLSRSVAGDRRPAAAAPAPLPGKAARQRAVA